MIDSEVLAIIENEKNHWWYAERRKILGNFLKQFNKNTRCLDLGPAGGYQTRVVKKEFGEQNTFALEYNFQAATICKNNIPNTLNGTGTTIPLKNDVINIVICMDTLEHIENDDTVVKEIFRILKKEGKVFISVPAKKILWTKHDVAVGHFRRYEKKDLTNLFLRNNFIIEKVYFWNVLLFPVMLLRRLIGKYQKDEEVLGDHKIPGFIVNLILSLIIKIERLVIFRYFVGSSIILVAKKN